MASLNVEITSTHIVKPSSPTPAHLKTYKLSLLDQLSPPVYPPLLIFYNPVQHITGSTITLRLKIALSKTLSRFFPFAGRINGDVFVDCNDAGIPYSEANVNLSLSELLQKDDLNLMKQLVPLTEESSDPDLDHSIPLLIQVSIFRCGGIAVGACSAHRIVDAATFFAFILEWANDSFGEKPVLIPDFSLPTRFPRVDFLNFDTGIKIPANDGLVRKRFVFSASSVSALKALANRCTRVQAVSALVWKCAMNASKSKSMIAMTLVNMRGRANPPLPELSFGNFVGSFLAEKHYDPEEEIDLGELVDKLRNGMKEFCVDYMEKVKGAEGIYEILNYSKRVGEMLQRDGVEVLTFSSWCGFPLYEFDFGYGKPHWISVANTPFRNGIMLMDTKEGNGIEVWANLDKQVMDVFEKDHDLLTFCS